jgi:hypothetical protein
MQVRADLVPEFGKRAELPVRDVCHLEYIVPRYISATEP